MIKILLIEDEEKTATYLTKGFAEQGYHIEWAADGQEGLGRVLEKDYDIVILDVMLPGQDGWTVIQEIRQAGKKTLALFLTAKDSVDDRIRGLDLGADAFLVKPFSFSELMAQVRSLLRRGPQIPAMGLLQIADLEIDPIGHIARRGGRRLDLTPKEFSLLHFLAARKGEILSRTKISEHVWNIFFDPGTNLVDVHIRRLRSKVDDPWEKKLIKTVRGLGYSLSEDA